jgi:hypothetical protein
VTQRGNVRIVGVLHARSWAACKGFTRVLCDRVAGMGFHSSNTERVNQMRTQAIAAVMAVAAPLWVLGSLQAVAWGTAGYGYQTAAVTPVAVRRPVAAAAVVRRGAVVPRVGSGARIGRTGPGNRGLGR